MPIITKVSPQKRTGRVNVYLDDKFAFGLNEETVVDHGLRVGKELTQEEVQRLEEQSEVGKLFNLTLRFLEYRPRSTKEIRDYLQQKIYKQKLKLESVEQVVLIERILEKLKQINLLNDLNFAQWWIRQRQQAGKPKGLRFIKMELKQKGIDEETIVEALQQLKSVGDEVVSDEELAGKTLERISYRYKGLDKREQRRKLSQYLLRRGFGWDTIKEILTTFDLLSTFPS